MDWVFEREPRKAGKSGLEGEFTRTAFAHDRAEALATMSE